MKKSTARRLQQREDAAGNGYFKLVSFFSLVKFKQTPMGISGLKARGW